MPQLILCILHNLLHKTPTSPLRINRESNLHPVLKGQLSRWFRLKAQEATGMVDPRTRETLEGIHNLVVGVLGSEDAAGKAFSTYAKLSPHVPVETKPFVQPPNWSRSI